MGEYDGDVIVNDAVLIEIKIAPQYDKRDEAQHSAQLWPVQGRI